MTEHLALPPDSLTLRAGDPLRFAVGSVEGPRSSTWTVAAARNSRDIYVGNRANMKDLKLSLHQSGKWRMAYVAAQPGVDRVLTRFDPPAEMFPGWRRAASIVVPTAFLRAPFPERASSTARPISWWPAPPDGSSFWFEILVAEAGAGPVIAEDVVGEVGQFPLAGGGGVWVIARIEEDARYVAEWEAMRVIRDGASARHQLNYRHPTAMAWGSVNRDGRPWLVDLGGELTAATPPDE